MWWQLQQQCSFSILKFDVVVKWIPLIANCRGVLQKKKHKNLYVRVSIIAQLNQNYLTHAQGHTYVCILFHISLCACLSFFISTFFVICLKLNEMKSVKNLNKK